jgi:hypothetical protein
MKLKTIVISIFALTLLIAACEEKSENNEENDQTDVSGWLTYHTDCKDTFKSGIEEKVTSDTLSCIQYEYDEAESILKIKHINAGFNCCPEELYCHFSFSGDTIVITESEKDHLCHCNCLYDLDMVLQNVEEKKYRIKLIEPYAESQAALNVEIDLASNTEGSFCVTRKLYPWGIIDGTN